MIKQYRASTPGCRLTVSTLESCTELPPVQLFFLDAGAPHLSANPYILLVLNRKNPDSFPQHLKSELELITRDCGHNLCAIDMIIYATKSCVNGEEMLILDKFALYFRQQIGTS